MGWESLLKFLINFYWQFLGGYDPRHFVYFIAIITYFAVVLVGQGVVQTFQPSVTVSVQSNLPVILLRPIKALP